MNVVAALLYAVATSVVVGLILGFQHGSLDPWVAVLSLSAGAVVGMIGWWRGHSKPAFLRPRGWAWLPVVLFTLFSLRAFLWLIFREGDELCVLSPNNLGDMSLHLTLIHYFANGAPLWPGSPIFAAGKLTYAPGMDLFNSLLTLAGVDVVRGLIWTGLLGALATGVALLRWGGAFTMLGFLCNGGLVGFACFFAADDEPFFQDYQADWAWKSFPLALLVTQRGFLFALPAGLLLLSSWRTRFFLWRDGRRLPFAGEVLLYATMPFFHPHTFLALSFMLAAFFFARPAARAGIAGLVALAFVPATLLVCLATGTLTSNSGPMHGDISQFASAPLRTPIEALGWQPGWMVNDDATANAWEKFASDHPAAEPFAAHGRFLFFWFGNFGVLPLLLVPVLLALLGPLLRYIPRPYNPDILPAVASVPRERRISAHTAWLLVVMAIVLTPFLGLLPGGEPAASLRPSAFVMLASAAPLALATLALGFLLRRISKWDHEDTWRAAFVFPALYLFFLCCNVRFAPWEWDNTKLMVWAVLIILPFIWEMLSVRWKPWARAVTCMTLFFSGFVSLLGGINGQHQGHAIAKLSTLDAVTVAVRPIPVTETFAAAPAYNHPLLLCGRKVVIGFEGHLGSHGIDYQSVGAELDALMNGDPDWRLRAARLGARYLFFGPQELERWPASQQPWKNDALLVASGHWGEIFDIGKQPLLLNEKPEFR